MASESRKTIRQLSSEIGRDFAQYAAELTANLRSETPKQSGTAQRGWRNKYKGDITTNQKVAIALNDVPYIGVLDTGTSRQAPRGIVTPALNKTRKK